MTVIFLAILAVVLSFGAAYMIPFGAATTHSKPDPRKLEAAKAEAQKIREQAHERAKQTQKLLDSEEKDLVEALRRMEESVKQKEDILKRREDRNHSFKQSAELLKKETEGLDGEAKKINQKMIAELSKAGKLPPEKALTLAQEKLAEVILENKEARQKAYMDERSEEAAKDAKAILGPIIQRMGTESSVDKNSTSVQLKSEKFKGLLIGKNGQNIAYLESRLPIAVIFNLNPEEIHVGGVNLLRRNIAKRAIEKLQKQSAKTGKIDHPMIDAAIQESEKEVMDICDQKGREALKLMDIDHKTVPAELVNYIGRMYFRTSFGQNILGHSLEMAYLAKLIAEQVGADVQVAMLAAFYHDIGKAIDHDVGGAHDDLSKEILEKHNFDPRIVHAAYAHHDKVPCLSPEDFIVKAVDAISAVRPGARQESVTNYFERIKMLEDTVKSFEGIKKVFAMSAGREVRGIVDERDVKDNQMEPLAEKISHKISDELSFPGVIKVNLIRRTISTDYAREKTADKGRRGV